VAVCAEELANRGFAILPDVLPASRLGRWRDKIDRLYAAQENAFGHVALAAIQDADICRAPLLEDFDFLDLATPPRIIAVMRHLLGDWFILSLQNAIISWPSVPHHQAHWHRDLIHQKFVSSRPLSINALLAIDPFPADTGGTHVLPFSHKIEELPSERYIDANQVAVSAPAGSAILFDSMLFHRAGANRSASVRRSVNHHTRCLFLSSNTTFRRRLATVLSSIRSCGDFSATLPRFPATPAPRDYRSAELPQNSVLPPGTILQLMWLRRRLRTLPPGRFIEIGPGAGEVTNLLLEAAWSGTAYDLADNVVARLRYRFAPAAATGQLTVTQGDYLATKADQSADLIISCMVMEHLNDADERRFMKLSAGKLRQGGRMIGLVPASPRHWGIEDEIAGHCRRYTRTALQQLAVECDWHLIGTAGLTYPLSNVLLPLSNSLVRRNEAAKLALPAIERTKLSGQRRVPLKTYFPSVMAPLLNNIVMMPFDLLQWLGRKSERALVLYFEAAPGKTRRDGLS
jgi:SAM-dependent methyltransferase